MEANDKQAVILSGGGAYGAYEVGVMTALFQGRSPATAHQPLDPEVFTGTSVGALNAAFMVSQPGTPLTTTIAQLAQLWLEEIADNPQHCGNGVLRLRGSPLDLFDPVCVLNHPLKPLAQLAADGVFFARDFLARGANFLASSHDLELRTLELVNLADFISVEPLRRLVEKFIQLEGIRRSAKTLRVAATNWETGVVEVYGNADLNDGFGHRIILASAAIPGIFPPVEVAGQPYVDGGVVENTPLLPAIRTGADVLHAIYLDPDVKNIPVERLQDTIDTIDRVNLIQWATKANEDLKTVRRLNQGLAVIERAARGAELLATDARHFFRVAAQIEARLKTEGMPRKLTVHRYSPRDDLGGPLGIINFTREQIGRLMQRGFDDAVNHNCEQSGCVLKDE